MSDEFGGGFGLLRSVPGRYRRLSYRHTVSWVFFGAFFAVVWGQGAFVVRRLGGSALQSLLLSVAQGLPMVPAILWVPLVERRNPVRLTAVVLGLGGAILIFSGLASSTWSLSAVLACSLLPATLYRPILGTALQRIYPAQWRGKLLSLPNTADMLARMLVLVFVGWALRRNLAAYRVLFPMAGVCMVVGALLFSSIPGGGAGEAAQAGRARLSVRRHVAKALHGALDNRMLLACLVGYFLCTCGGVLHWNALPLFARDEIHLDTAQWGYASAASLLTTLASFWFWGVFMDRHGAPLTMVLCWIGLGAMMGLVVFVQSWPALFAVVAARGVFLSGNLMAFFPIVMHFTSSAETTRGMGLHGSLWGLRWVLMPLIVIVTVDGSLFLLRGLFVISFCLVAVGTATVARVWWLDRRGTGGGGPRS
ncbi:MAG: MFS transporter [Planctomycetota bacterium]|jgi:MFS family permease